MQRCQNAKSLMESNDVGTYLYGCGMSIATQRAKERQNRTPGAKSYSRNGFCWWADSGGCGCPGVGGAGTRGGQRRWAGGPGARGSRDWAKIRGKMEEIGGFHGGKGGDG